jgi:hypothetical protein
VINPRDMKVYRIIQGVNPDAATIPVLSSLLTKNGAPPPPRDAGAATDAESAPDAVSDAAATD